MPDHLKMYLIFRGHARAAETSSETEFVQFKHRADADPEGTRELVVEALNRQARVASGLPANDVVGQLPSVEEKAALIRHQRALEDELAAKAAAFTGSTTRLRDESERYMPPTTGPSLGQRVKADQAAEFERLAAASATTKGRR
jgi:hypothetical protein